MGFFNKYALLILLPIGCASSLGVARAEYFVFHNIEVQGRTLRLSGYDSEIDELLMSSSFPMNTNPQFKGVYSQMSESERVQLDRDEVSFLRAQINGKLGKSDIQLEYIPTSLYELIMLTEARDDCRDVSFSFDEALRTSLDDYGKKVHQINRDPNLLRCREEVNSQIGLLVNRARVSNVHEAYPIILEKMLEKKYSADQSSRLKALIRKVFFIEIEEAKKGRFLLYRGIEKDIPEGALKTKQKEGEEDFYYCRSLSYGASLYAGVLYDRYERSACALIHMLDPTKKAYLLSLDKSAYREGKLPFYFPPIHVTASFNGWGEFFHPRAKFSPFGKNGKKVEGISIFAFRFLNADHCE